MMPDATAESAAGMSGGGGDSGDGDKAKLLN